MVCFSAAKYQLIPVLLACSLLAFNLQAHAEEGVTSRINQYIFTRQCVVRLYPVDDSTAAIIPFAYPTRPTVLFSICGRDYALLFDTGTQCCLLQPREGEVLPEQLRFSQDPDAIAGLEAKQAFSAAGDELLRYAEAGCMSSGQVLYLRDVPVRVYPPSLNPDRDYSGAFAATLLADYFIEVDNSQSQLRLHSRQNWRPPESCLMLPLMLLPRGYFMPAYLDGEQYWFHLDTGFSGGIGLTDQLWESLRESITPGSGKLGFSGWHDELELASGQLQIPFELNAYPAMPWANSANLALSGQEVVRLKDAYRELASEGYTIGGIVGSGCLSKFNYVLDLRLMRLYLLGSSGL